MCSDHNCSSGYRPFGDVGVEVSLWVADIERQNGEWDAARGMVCRRYWEGTERGRVELTLAQERPRVHLRIRHIPSPLVHSGASREAPGPLAHRDRAAARAGRFILRSIA